MDYEKMFFNYNKEPGKRRNKNVAIGDKKPLVSIVTSYYNSDEFFMQTVNCVLNQTFPFWEWIIVNDGSTKKGTKNFLESIKKIDGRIKIYEKENGGLAKGRDYAISKSTTKYILPLDSDDLIIDTYIETAYWSLETNKDAAWAYSNNVGFGKYIYLYNKKFDSEILKDENLLTATALIRKDKILELQGYGVAKRYVNEDWHLWLRMLAKEYFPVQMNFYGFWYRRKKESLLSHINDKENKENILRLKDLKQEADKITKIVKAKIYPQENDDIIKESIDWDFSKEFGIKVKENRILYILRWLKTDKGLYKQIKSIKEEESDITIVTLQPCQYIYRQKFEEYAKIYDLTTFLDKKYWDSFIQYIIKTRKINMIYIANDIKQYILHKFEDINVKEYDYRDDDSVLLKQQRKYEKSKKLCYRIIRKIKNIIINILERK